MRVHQLADAHLDAAADVVLPVGKLGCRRGGEIGRGDVADVDEVAGLRPVAVDRRCPAGEHLIPEDRDHAGVAFRVLAGPVHVAVPQRDHIEPAGPPEPVAVLLRGPLAEPVRRAGPRRDGLGRGDLRALAVDGAARGGVDHSASTGRRCGGEDVDGPEHVDRRVVRGVGHRGPHVDLGSEVEHDLRAEVGEGRRERVAVPDVDLGEVRRPPVEVGETAAAEVVHDEDLATVVDHRVDDV